MCWHLNNHYFYGPEIDMGKGKQAKWADNQTFQHVFEPPLNEIIAGRTFMKGEWHKLVFKNDNPITVELGCGKGEYTIGLARKYPDRNFIGVDSKGHRIWTGARQSVDENLDNVAFLRTKIEFINSFFTTDEIDEIWLTFSDPQPKDEKGTKRLTSPIFIDRYKKFIKAGSIIHVKSDSQWLYDNTIKELRENGYEIVHDSNDLYGGLIHTLDDSLADLLRIRTYYEQLFIEKGAVVKYIQFRV